MTGSLLTKFATNDAPKRSPMFSYSYPNGIVITYNLNLNCICLSLCTVLLHVFQSKKQWIRQCLHAD